MNFILLNVIIIILILCIIKLQNLQLSTKVITAFIIFILCVNVLNYCLNNTKENLSTSPLPSTLLAKTPIKNDRNLKLDLIPSYNRYSDNILSNYNSQIFCNKYPSYPGCDNINKTINSTNFTMALLSSFYNQDILKTFSSNYPNLFNGSEVGISNNNKSQLTPFIPYVNYTINMEAIKNDLNLSGTGNILDYNTFITMISGTIAESKVIDILNTLNNVLIKYVGIGNNTNSEYIDYKKNFVNNTNNLDLQDNIPDYLQGGDPDLLCTFSEYGANNNTILSDEPIVNGLYYIYDTTQYKYLNSNSRNEVKLTDNIEYFYIKYIDDGLYTITNKNNKLLSFDTSGKKFIDQQKPIPETCLLHLSYKNNEFKIKCPVNSIEFSNSAMIGKTNNVLNKNLPKNINGVTCGDKKIIGRWVTSKNDCQTACTGVTDTTTSEGIKVGTCKDDPTISLCSCCNTENGQNGRTFLTNWLDDKIKDLQNNILQTIANTSSTDWTLYDSQDPYRTRFVNIYAVTLALIVNLYQEKLLVDNSNINGTYYKPWENITLINEMRQFIQTYLPPLKKMINQIYFQVMKNIQIEFTIDTSIYTNLATGTPVICNVNYKFLNDPNRTPPQPFENYNIIYMDTQFDTSLQGRPTKWDKIQSNVKPNYELLSNKNFKWYWFYNEIFNNILEVNYNSSNNIFNNDKYTANIKFTLPTSKISTQSVTPSLGQIPQKENNYTYNKLSDIIQPFLDFQFPNTITGSPITTKPIRYFSNSNLLFGINYQEGDTFPRDTTTGLYNNIRYYTNSLFNGNDPSIIIESFENIAGIYNDTLLPGPSIINNVVTSNNESFNIYPFGVNALSWGSVLYNAKSFNYNCSDVQKYNIVENKDSLSTCTGSNNEEISNYFNISNLVNNRDNINSFCCPADSSGNIYLQTCHDGNKNFKDNNRITYCVSNTNSSYPPILRDTLNNFKCTYSEIDYLTKNFLNLDGSYIVSGGVYLIKNNKSSKYLTVSENDNTLTLSSNKPNYGFITNSVLLGDNVTRVVIGATQVFSKPYLYFFPCTNSKGIYMNNGTGTERVGEPRISYCVPVGAVTINNYEETSTVSFGVDKYVKIDNTSLFIDQKLSVSFWIKKDVSTTPGGILYIGDTSDPNKIFIYIDSNSKLITGYNTVSNNWNISVTNYWNHYTLTICKKISSLYLNGILLKTFENANELSDDVGSYDTMYIGKTIDQVGFAGEMYDFQLYTSCLTPFEIFKIYNNTQLKQVNPLYNFYFGQNTLNYGTDKINTYFTIKNPVVVNYQNSYLYLNAKNEQYIVLPSIPATQELTLSITFSSSNNAIDTRLLELKGSDNKFIAIEIRNNTTIMLIFPYQNNMSSVSVDNLKNINDNSWNKITWVISTTSSLLYLNNNIVHTSNTVPNFPANMTFTTNYIGYSNNKYFNGNIYDFALYNRALSYYEIVKEITVPEKTISGYLQYSKTDNKIIIDSTIKTNKEAFSKNSCIFTVELQNNGSYTVKNSSLSNLFWYYVNYNNSDIITFNNVSDTFNFINTNLGVYSDLTMDARTHYEKIGKYLGYSWNGDLCLTITKIDKYKEIPISSNIYNNPKYYKTFKTLCINQKIYIVGRINTGLTCFIKNSDTDFTQISETATSTNVPWADSLSWTSDQAQYSTIRSFVHNSNIYFYVIADKIYFKKFDTKTNIITDVGNNGNFTGWSNNLKYTINNIVINNTLYIIGYSDKFEIVEFDIPNNFSIGPYTPETTTITISNTSFPYNHLFKYTKIGNTIFTVTKQLNSFIIKSFNTLTKVWKNHTNIGIMIDPSNSYFTTFQVYSINNIIYMLYKLQDGMHVYSYNVISEEYNLDLAVLTSLSDTNGKYCNGSTTDDNTIYYSTLKTSLIGTNIYLFAVNTNSTDRDKNIEYYFYDTIYNTWLTDYNSIEDANYPKVLENTNISYASSIQLCPIYQNNSVFLGVKNDTGIIPYNIKFNSRPIELSSVLSSNYILGLKQDKKKFYWASIYDLNNWISLGLPESNQEIISFMTLKNGNILYIKSEYSISLLNINFKQDPVEIINNSRREFKSITTIYTGDLVGLTTDSKLFILNFNEDGTVINNATEEINPNTSPVPILKSILGYPNKSLLIGIGDDNFIYKTHFYDRTNLIGGWRKTLIITTGDSLAYTVDGTVLFLDSNTLKGTDESFSTSSQILDNFDSIKSISTIINTSRDILTPFLYYCPYANNMQSYMNFGYGTLPYQNIINSDVNLIKPTNSNIYVMSFETSNESNKVTLPVVNNFDNNSFSISLWLRVTNNEEKIIFAFGEAGGSTLSMSTIGGTNSGVIIKTTTVLTPSSINVPSLINNWVHICWLFSQNNLTIYINGTSSTPIPSSMTLTSFVTNYIGSTGLIGQMYDFRFYTRAISVSEISNIYNKSNVFDVNNVIPSVPLTSPSPSISTNVKPDSGIFTNPTPSLVNNLVLENPDNFSTYRYSTISFEGKFLSLTKNPQTGLNMINLSNSNSNPKAICKFMIKKYEQTDNFYFYNTNATNVDTESTSIDNSVGYLSMNQNYIPLIMNDIGDDSLTRSKARFYIYNVSGNPEKFVIRSVWNIYYLKYDNDSMKLRFNALHPNEATIFTFTAIREKVYRTFNNMYYSGNDITALTGLKDSNECKYYCDSTDDCITYNYSSGSPNDPSNPSMCQLKSTLDAPISDNNFTTYIKSDLPTYTYNTESNTNYSNSNIISLAGKTVEECKILCDNAKDCNGFTYSNQTCNLKNKFTLENKTTDSNFTTYIDTRYVIPPMVPTPSHVLKTREIWAIKDVIKKPGKKVNPYNRNNEDGGIYVPYFPNNSYTQLNQLSIPGDLLKDKRGQEFVYLLLDMVKVDTQTGFQIFPVPEEANKQVNILTNIRFLDYSDYEELFDRGVGTDIDLCHFQPGLFANKSVLSGTFEPAISAQNFVCALSLYDSNNPHTNYINFDSFIYTYLNGTHKTIYSSTDRYPYDILTGAGSPYRYLLQYKAPINR
jgi:hypothetical protein